MPDGDETRIYEAVGRKSEPFVALVDEFYRGVNSDAELRALYPEDLAPGKEHLAWFLIQRFGGPEMFNARRGAPMLRRRHMPFAITRRIAARWLAHMCAAVAAVPEFEPHRKAMTAYFEDAAVFLINRNEPAAGSDLNGGAEQGP